MKKYMHLKGEEKEQAQKLFLGYYFGEDLSLGSTARKMKKIHEIEISSTYVGAEITRLGYKLRNAHDYRKNNTNILERYGKDIKKRILDLRHIPEPMSYCHIAEIITAEIQPISFTAVRKINMKMEKEMESGNPPFR